MLVESHYTRVIVDVKVRDYYLGTNLRLAS